MHALAYNANYGKWFANDVLEAIKRYGLVNTGEQVAVGLSGGKDSTTLLFIMEYLRRFSHLECSLVAAHVKTASYDTGVLREFCERLSVPYYETALERPAATRVKNHCYLCARLKRGALHRLLSSLNIRKVAFGHHATDVAETFLMNVVEHKKLGSFCPRVEIGADALTIIRPMAYLDERTVERIHRHAGLPLMAYDCPFAHDNLRRRYKERFQQVAKDLEVKDLARRIVAALENVDRSNMWEAVRLP